MSKSLFRIVCFGMILALCLPMVACDIKMGGLVGELLASLETSDVNLDHWGNDAIIEDVLPDIETAVVTNQDEFFTGDVGYTEMPTEDVTHEYDYDTTEPFTSEDFTTEPPVEIAPIPDPIMFFSFDECDAWIGDQNVQQFFVPGSHASWNKHAVIDDCHVEYVRVWGWVAFDTEQIGEIGYSIDRGEYVFDSEFLIEAEQPILDAIGSFGALSASRINVQIPVRDLSGEHVIEIVGRDAFGYTEVIEEFTFDKAVDPNAPVFSFWAADMISSLPGSVDIEDVQLSETGAYLTITTGTVGDPWYLLPMVNGKGFVANYVAIKYRTTSETTTGEVFVGSGPGPSGQGDNIRYEIINDGKWHVAILDLSQAAAVKDGVINYLRWDMFMGGQNNVVDVAYIAAFLSEQAALDYDARLGNIHYDAYVVPQADWVISGHSREIVDENAPSGLFPMIQAAGIASGALLHQGAVFVGDVDLSKYSKVYVYYGIDNSQVTQDHYNANPSNRIMLTSVDVHMRNSPEEREIVASTVYTLNGWAVQRFEIDLTGIDYTGPVYVTYDTLPGTFMVIGAIEFVE